MNWVHICFGEFGPIVESLPIPVDLVVTDNIRKRHYPSISSVVISQTQGYHKYCTWALVLLVEELMQRK